MQSFSSWFPFLLLCVRRGANRRDDGRSGRAPSRKVDVGTARANSTGKNHEPRPHASTKTAFRISYQVYVMEMDNKWPTVHVSCVETRSRGNRTGSEWSPLQYATPHWRFFFCSEPGSSSYSYYYVSYSSLVLISKKIYIYIFFVPRVKPFFSLLCQESSHFFS